VPFPFDFNEDGFMDIYVTNDKSQPNRLYLNNNGVTFTEEGNYYGVDTSDNDMGMTMGDYNRDGHLDIFILF